MKIFFFSIKNKRPFITVKSAMTLDGNCATLKNDSKWITNSESRKFGHYLRKINDCVMIGSNTLKTDDPTLNIRLYKNKYKTETKIAVLDSNLIFRSDSKIAVSSKPENVYIFTSVRKTDKKFKILSDKGFKIHKVRKNKNFLDLKPVLNILHENSINSVLVEGGPTLIAEFFKNKFVNKIHYMYAPKILGLGINAVNGVVSDRITDSIEVNNMEIRRFDTDFMVTGYCKY